MTERIAEASPRFKAKIAGVFYLLTILTGVFALFLRGRLVVSGDAAATATNILAHEPLYRLSGAAILITLACDTAVALIFYDLLNPASRSISLLAAIFRLMYVTILAVSSLNYVAPLALLGTASPVEHMKIRQAAARRYSNV